MRSASSLGSVSGGHHKEYDPPGGILGDFVAGGNPADTLRVKHTLYKLKELAESLRK